MPNKFNSGRDRSRSYYYEHDDRMASTSSSEPTRRVSFKNFNSRHKGRNKRQGWDNKLRVLLDDDDVEMVTNNTARNGDRIIFHARNYGGRRGRNPPRISRDSPIPHSRKLPDLPFHWYKVTVINGQKYEKDYIYRLLMSYIKPTPFYPVGYKKYNDECIFYVDDYKSASQILAANRKITTTDNIKLHIKVQANLPYIEIDEKLKEKMKMAMSHRYNVITRSLDMKRFHVDTELVKDDTFIPLNRPNMLATAVKLIIENIPDIQALDLSDNKLSSVDALKILVDKTSHLKVLHVGNNRLQNMSHLDCLQGLQIEDLILDGNSLCDNFRDQAFYIREVRKRFPKVVKLDGIDLPPPISFDVEDTCKLVPSHGSFLCNPAGGPMVQTFLEQYYAIYDSSSRNPLLDAYHDAAQFSLSCAQNPSNILAPYLSENRNLKIISSIERRERLLKKGKTSIISFLSSLPQTQHDLRTFVVDLILFTEQLIMVTVNGVFREVGKKQPLKAFNKVMIIVPAGSGFCIVNDLVYVSLATSDQKREAFKEIPVEAPVQQAVSPVAPVPLPVPSVASSPQVADIAARQQMVTTLAAQTNMNLAWSEKCLNETNWDFDRAMFVFTELHKQGTIPAEAFIK